jgi:putative phage-type endonuclease
MTREEWLEWRKGGIGASDVPKLMGLYGFGGRYELWQRLSGIPVEEIKDNIPMKFGRDVEESVIKMIEDEEMLLDLERQVIFVCDAQPYLRATVDAYSKNMDCIYEIKCFSGDEMHKILNGVLPTSVELQVQAQLLCSGALRAKVVGRCVDTGRKAYIEVKSDKKIQDEILMQVKYMKEKVEKLQRIDDYKLDKDFKDFHLDQIIEKYLETMPTQEEIDKAAKHAMYENQIKEYAAKHGSISVNGVMAKVSTVKGRINYQAVPELLGVDLEEYRAAPTQRVSVSVSRPS